MFSRRALLTGIAATAAAVALPAARVPAASFVGELAWQVATFRGLRVDRVVHTIVHGSTAPSFATVFFQGDDGTTGSMSTADDEVIKQMEGYARSGTSITMELKHQQPAISFTEDESWSEHAQADAETFEDWDEKGRRDVT